MLFKRNGVISRNHIICGHSKDVEEERSQPWWLVVAFLTTLGGLSVWFGSKVRVRKQSRWWKELLARFVWTRAVSLPDEPECDKIRRRTTRRISYQKFPLCPQTDGLKSVFGGAWGPSKMVIIGFAGLWVFAVSLDCFKWSWGGRNERMGECDLAKQTSSISFPFPMKSENGEEARGWEENTTLKMSMKMRRTMRGSSFKSIHYDLSPLFFFLSFWRNIDWFCVNEAISFEFSIPILARSQLAKVSLYLNEVGTKRHQKKNLRIILILPGFR